MSSDLRNALGIPRSFQHVQFSRGSKFEKKKEKKKGRPPLTFENPFVIMSKLRNLEKRNVERSKCFRAFRRKYFPGMIWNIRERLKAFP